MDNGNGKTSERTDCMISYETWEKHKVTLQNESWTPFGKWPTDVQDAMREIEPSLRMYLEASGMWGGKPVTLFPGMAYRVSASWPGPAKPEPVAEYDDLPVFLHKGIFAINSDGYQNCIALANALTRFAGYVMPDGKLRPRLIFDLQKDGTYRLRVPVAVRLLKEVVR